jgi:hypothetical protein
MEVPPISLPSPTRRSDLLVAVTLGVLALGLYTALAIALFWKRSDTTSTRC